MKKIVCVIIVLLLTGCCAYAEETTELWAHEAGWMGFQLALSQDNLDSAWEESIGAFGESLNMPGLPVSAVKSMLLKGTGMESGVDVLSVAGNTFTGSSIDGTPVFSHEYTWVETLEEEGILGGARVHVFMTAEADAGIYKYLMMTEPVRTEGEDAGYTTFNLACTGEDDYRAALGSMIPRTMIEKDTGLDGLLFAIGRLFSGTIVIGK